jgi:hypothetical protein
MNSIALDLKNGQGTDASHVNGWNDAANAAIKAGAKHLLGCA